MVSSVNMTGEILTQVAKLIAHLKVDKTTDKGDGANEGESSSSDLTTQGPLLGTSGGQEGRPDKSSTGLGVNNGTSGGLQSDGIGTNGEGDGGGVPDNVERGEVIREQPNARIESVGENEAVANGGAPQRPNVNNG